MNSDRSKDIGLILHPNDEMVGEREMSGYVVRNSKSLVVHVPGDP